MCVKSHNKHVPSVCIYTNTYVSTYIHMPMCTYTICFFLYVYWEEEDTWETNFLKGWK